MTENTGKERKRKSPMEGFNNVPKILEEARRMVDAVTQADMPAESAGTTKPAKPEDVIVQPAPEINLKKPRVKKTSPQVAQDTKAAAANKQPKVKPAVSAPVSEVALTTETTPSVNSTAPAKPALTPEKFGISIKHRVPGRTRLEIRKMKYNESFARRVEECLAIVPGVIAVETSTITASAVFYYNPRELCRPAALLALQEAWQELFPRMQTEKLTTEMTCQQLR